MYYRLVMHGNTNIYIYIYIYKNICRCPLMLSIYRVVHSNK